jgi:hypothetical protein
MWGVGQGHREAAPAGPKVFRRKDFGEPCPHPPLRSLFLRGGRIRRDSPSSRHPAGCRPRWPSILWAELPAFREVRRSHLQPEETLKA